MYTFLMVDDEEIVRRGFRRKIDWESIGFQFLEPCVDGREAIEAIERLHPDVVMTDIYMPHVDGLAVAQYAAEHSPSTLVVILSGYDEFEFAQKAIRTRAVDYVLKPVNSRELTQLLLRLRSRLDTERRTREDDSLLHVRAEIGDELLKGRGLLDLVTAAQPSPREEQFEGLFGFSPRGMACAALVAESDSSLPEGSLAEKPLREALQAAAQASRWALPFFPGEGRGALLVFQPDREACDRLCGALAGKIAGSGGSGTAVGVGRSCAEWTSASRSYEEAAAALCYRLVRGSGGVFRWVAAREEDPAALAELKRFTDILCRSVLAGEADEAEEKADALLHRLAQAGLPPQRIRHEVDTLFDVLLDGFGTLGISAATLSEDLGLDYERSVDRLRTAEQVHALLSRLSSYARSVLRVRNLPAPKWKSLDVQEYVARHYADKELSVQKVARSLAISASYLSKLAKRYLGVSFVEYLTAVRMERAMDMLATTDLMSYEIAEATGYADARYFSALFKKHTGRTPSEYRAERRRKMGQQ
jgi:two-component system, response regulator YesN